MQGDLRVRKVKTASGATAVQVIRYKSGKRIVIRHIGNAHTNEELAVLIREAEVACDQLSSQLTLFSMIGRY